MTTFADRLRAKAYGAIEMLPGKVGALALKANEALGRPLADSHELEDRKAFTGVAGGARIVAASKPVVAAPDAEIALVVVYHMDKSRRDSTVLTDMLTAELIPFRVINIQEDPSAQMSVKRDSKGFRLPLVMIAGEAIGGRAELSNLIASGQLKKRVFGA